MAIRYEDLVSYPEACCNALLQFIPELDSLDFSASFDVHSVLGRGCRPITDMNAEKLARMSAQDVDKAWQILATEFPEELVAWRYRAPAHVPKIEA